MSWGDLRLVLAIGRCGSLSGAAGELGLNVSTCSRRLTQLEEALKVLCFVRRPSGVELTAAGQIVYDHAEAIEQQTVSLGHSLAAINASDRSKVIVTCPDSLAAAMVIPALQLSDDIPGTPQVTLITDNRLMALHRGEADIALRLRRPTEGGLRVRRIATVGYGLFASRDYIDQHGDPGTLEALSEHFVVAVNTVYPNHPPAVWWAEHCSDKNVIVATDRTLDRAQCAENGLGITMLPVSVGKARNLTRVLAAEKLPSLEVFMLAEPGALRVPAIRKVADQLANFAKRHANHLL